MRIKAMVSIGVFALILAGISSHAVWAATELPKEKIVEIAKAKASECGVKLGSAKIIYDEGNKMFAHPLYPECVPGTPQYKECHESVLKQTLPRRDESKLKRKNYQAICFSQPMQESLWVVVDRNNGEVLDAAGDY